MAKIVLMKIGAAWCAPCVSMDKKGTLDRFAKKHEGELKVEVHDDTEDGTARWENFADKWKIKATPTFIWLYQGVELFRTTGGKSLDVLEEELARAVRKVEKLG